MTNPLTACDRNTPPIEPMLSNRESPADLMERKQRPAVRDQDRAKGADHPEEYEPSDQHEQVRQRSDQCE